MIQQVVGSQLLGSDSGAALGDFGIGSRQSDPGDPTSPGSQLQAGGEWSSCSVGMPAQRAPGDDVVALDLGNPPVEGSGMPCEV